MTTITIDSSTREIQDLLRKQAYRTKLSKQTMQDKNVPCKPFSPTTEAPDLQGRVSPDFLDERTKKILLVGLNIISIMLSVYLVNQIKAAAIRSVAVRVKKSLVSSKESHQKKHNRYAEQKKTYTDELAKLRKDEAREEDRMKEAGLNYKIKFCEGMMKYHQERIAKYESKIAQVNKELEAIGN